MGIIQVLDETLSNQIAAGEVVERPASVAKELLENALDAGASTITVELAEGGVARLRVTDNGRGMSPEDAVLALERHATSKVRTVEDLSHIHTLGFRGEALPSIASVSRFRIRTREADALGATVVVVEGGRRRAPTEAAGPPGTEVLVEDLFFNVPARRKFLKRADTEAAHVQDIVVQLALAWPGIAFRLVKDGRTALDLPRHDGLADRVRALFGRETGDRLIPVGVDGAFSMEGLIGAPPLAFGTPRHLHCFINGRHVRDRVVIAAVQAAFAGALEKGRYPFVVLHMRMPPEALDVNVHPAKTEVRFVDSGAIHRFIHRHLADFLRRDGQAPPTPLFDEPPPATAADRPVVAEPEPAPAAAPARTRTYDLDPAPAPGTGEPSPTTHVPAGDTTSGPTGLDAHRQRIFDAMERLGARRAGWSGSPAGTAAPASAHRAGPPSGPVADVSAVAWTPPPPVPAHHRAEHSPLAAWRPVALLTPRLGLCLAPGALMLLDLPAARRALFTHRLGAGAAPVRLATPTVVALSAAELDRLGRGTALWTSLGFDVEAFGEGTAVVKALPAGLEGAGSPDALLRLALQEPLSGAVARLAAIVADVAPPDATPAELGALVRALAPFEASVPRWAVPLAHAELERRLPRGPGEGGGAG